MSHLDNGPHWLCGACQSPAYGWTDPEQPNRTCPTCGAWALVAVERCAASSDSEVRSQDSGRGANSPWSAAGE